MFHKSTYLWVHSVDFHPSMNHAWQYYQTPKSTIASKQFCLLNFLSQFCLQFNFVFCTSKSKMAFSCHNSSTLVLLLGTLFNTISYFSNQMAYPPNALQCSRRIHQRGHSSLRSLSNTIQPGQTVLSIHGPSIVSVDNSPNWEDAPANPITNNNTANRPISSTCLQSKPCWSKNTNKQLANILGWLVKILNSNQTLSSNTNTRETKSCISDIFSSTEPDKLNNFLFQYHLYFHANLVQFNIDIVKINFAMTYLTGIA